jgi:ankyrin repeat protein
MAAASEGDDEEVAMMLRLGNIDINEGDNDRRTALHAAAGNGHTQVIKLLCESGANVNITDRWGGSPLDDAKFYGHKECEELLLKYGAKYGNTNSNMGREALIDLFDQHGKMRNGELSLDWQDVSGLLRSVGHDATEAVVRKLFEVVDINNDGFISKGGEKAECMMIRQFIDID